MSAELSQFMQSSHYPCFSPALRERKSYSTFPIALTSFGEESQKATFKSMERTQEEGSLSDDFYLIISLLINRVITAFPRERTMIKG